MCYPVTAYKRTLAAYQSGPCSHSGFPVSLTEWSFLIVVVDVVVVVVVVVVGLVMKL